MDDPVYTAIIATKISLLFSHPDEGRRLAPLQPRQVDSTETGIAARRGELLYKREFVKSLTQQQLRDRLIAIAQGMGAI